MQNPYCCSATVDGDELYGDGINIAARVEGLAEPGEICVSGMPAG